MPRNIRPQSSQLAELLWTNPGRKSGISVRELISTLKKKRRRRGMNGRTFCQHPRIQGKNHHQWEVTCAEMFCPSALNRFNYMKCQTIHQGLFINQIRKRRNLCKRTFPFFTSAVQKVRVEIHHRLRNIRQRGHSKYIHEDVCV